MSQQGILYPAPILPEEDNVDIIIPRNQVTVPEKTYGSPSDHVIIDGLRCQSLMDVRHHLQEDIM